MLSDSIQTSLMAVFTIAALALGFVGLLMQKTYLDARTKKIMEVEIPLVGKMKTNYPAMGFVFASLVFGYFYFQASKEIQTAKEHWTGLHTFTVQAHLKTDPPITDLSLTDIVLIPRSVHPSVLPNHTTFEITVDVPQWQGFEDFVDAIAFQHDKLSGLISARAENDTSNCRDPSTNHLKINNRTRTLICEVNLR